MFGVMWLNVSWGVWIVNLFVDFCLFNVVCVVVVVGFCLRDCVVGWGEI